MGSVTFNSDGYMYSGSAQLTLTSVLQADGVGKQVANQNGFGRNRHLIALDAGDVQRLVDHLE